MSRPVVSARSVCKQQGRVDLCRVQFDEWVADGAVQVHCQGCVCNGLLGSIMFAVSKYEVCLYACEPVSVGCEVWEYK